MLRDKPTGRIRIKALPLIKNKNEINKVTIKTDFHSDGVTFSTVPGGGGVKIIVPRLGSE